MDLRPRGEGYYLPCPLEHATRPSLGPEDSNGFISLIVRYLGIDVSEAPAASFLKIENGGISFIRRTGNYVSKCTASHPRR